MTDKELTTLIGLCSQWWPNARAPEKMSALVISWRLLLADVDFDMGVAALSEYATSGAEFPPPVGAIKRKAALLAMPGGQAPPVDEAWGEVLSEIRRVGWITALPGGPTVRFTHPAIQLVVDAMGWKNLCESENAVADRAHFAQMYRERVERETDQAAQAPNVLEFKRRLKERGESEPVALGQAIADALPARVKDGDA